MTRRELDPWVEGYLSYLAGVRRLAPRSVADARCSLKKIAEFIEGRRVGTPLWKLSLDDFLSYVTAERDAGSADNAIVKQLSQVRGLLEYAWRSGRTSRNVLDGFSLQETVRKSPPRVLTIEEAGRLVEASSSRTPLQRRDRIVILLLYGCGLRTAELRALDVQDIDLERKQLFVKKGKGDRQRIIPVPSAVWTELLAYLAERGGKKGPLFRMQAKGGRITTEQIGVIVKTTASSASIPGPVTPKTLRHTFGTHLMDRGVDVAVIASLMGHRTPAETGVYLHVLPGRAQAAVRTLLDDEEGDEG